MRTFFRDKLGFKGVDAGGGWLIFTLPPAELAVHPARDRGRHEVYLLCDDVVATTKRLTAKGVKLEGGVTDVGWGLLTYIRLPDGSRIGLYEPKHGRPAGWKARQSRRRSSPAKRRG